MALIAWPQCSISLQATALRAVGRRSGERLLVWDADVAIAALGTAWLLQFIEDMQQSREFHKTCELQLPSEIAKLPEVYLYPTLTIESTR